MQKLLKTLAVGTALGTAALFVTTGAQAADSGTIAKAVGGYTFEDAAKEAPGTKDFHSKEGHLTFAVVTLGILNTDLGRVDDLTYR